jgi:hypothetical protein
MLQVDRLSRLVPIRPLPRNPRAVPSQKPPVTRELCIVSTSREPFGPSISSLQAALPCRILSLVLTLPYPPSSVSAATRL